MTRLHRAIVRLETGAAGALVIAVAAAVLLQVTMRYGFARPNPWSEEFARFGFIWLSLLGSSLAVHRRSHFRFDRAVRRLSPRTRKAATLLAKGATLGFALLLVATGLALMDLASGQRSAALDLPMAFVYAAAPVSGLLMAIHLLGEAE